VSNQQGAQGSCRRFQTERCGPNGVAKRIQHAARWRLHEPQLAGDAIFRIENVLAGLGRDGPLPHEHDKVVGCRHALAQGRNLPAASRPGRASQPIISSAVSTHRSSTFGARRCES